ncbi:MAG: hypothetical protein MAGBODY4_01663 [Candidatus Marinimicrobia bacterium]|nr:hypothetical protein [Candidatus Neomarinimicrobiota bacterium]
MYILRKICQIEKQAEGFNDGKRLFGIEIIYRLHEFIQRPGFFLPPLFGRPPDMLLQFEQLLTGLLPDHFPEEFPQEIDVSA